ncbi:MAG: hypothetical protein KF690_07070 [Bacteroidetes bacterium]|nr:hypothetical protein [Bacteroidota bacterium]
MKKLNKLLLAAMIFLCTLPTLHAQNAGPLTKRWGQYYPGIDTASVSAISIDAQRCVVVVGAKDNGIGFNIDVEVFKYNPQGVLMWSRTLDFFGKGDGAADVVVDADRNIYVVGGAVETPGSRRMFITKLTGQGDTLWTDFWETAPSPGGWTNTVANKVVVDTDGNVYVAGTRSRFSPSYTSQGFLLKYDSSGAVVWQDSLSLAGNGEEVSVVAMKLNSQEQPLVGYSVEGSNSDILLVQYEANGDSSWQARYARTGSTNDRMTEMAFDNEDNLYVAGISYVSFTGDMLLLKFNNAGSLQWQQFYSPAGSTLNTAWSLVVNTAANRVYTTGGGEGVAPTLAYDLSGNLQWADDSSYTEGFYEGRFVRLLPDGRVVVLQNAGDDSGNSLTLLRVLNPDGSLGQRISESTPGKSYLAAELEVSADSAAYALWYSQNADTGQEIAAFIAKYKAALPDSGAYTPVTWPNGGTASLPNIPNPTRLIGSNEQGTIGSVVGENNGDILVWEDGVWKTQPALTGNDSIWTASGDTVVHLLANRRVGIGIAQPQATLHTVGRTILGAGESADTTARVQLFSGLADKAALEVLRAPSKPTAMYGFTSEELTLLDSLKLTPQDAAYQGIAGTVLDNGGAFTPASTQATLEESPVFLAEYPLVIRIIIPGQPECIAPVTNQIGDVRIQTYTVTDYGGWSPHQSPDPRSATCGGNLRVDRSIYGQNIYASQHLGVGASMHIGSVNSPGGYYHLRTTTLYGNAGLHLFSMDGVYNQNRPLQGIFLPKTGGVRLENTGLVVTPQGNVGIGTASPQKKFVVGDSTLVVTSQGNVGIGVANPGSKLAVDGLVCAREVRVSKVGGQNSGICQWPDYVFEPGYSLMPLDKLEDYLKTHKHLPEVPAAKTVEQDGLYVGEMQYIQMKKIEELTLYIIQLEKRIKELENSR